MGTAGFGALLVFVAIACAAQGFGSIQDFGRGGLAVVRAYHEVVVQPGDTLWEIAVEYGDSSRDPRAIVDELRRINGLRSASLHVGDVLQVPVSEPAWDAR